MEAGGEFQELSATKALLHRALDLPREERREFLEAHLSPGKVLEEAFALLEGVEGLDGFLEAPLAPGHDVFEAALPERIADYEVERVLGWGSMGVVYLARQAEPARAVALKLLRIDAVTEDTVARFRREADLLARLNHPGLATIYEAGVADLGTGEQPWFSMEYIEGLSLLAHAETAGLDQRGRVRLVLQAARAVQHAHEQGVVHRDLKPENVIVREGGSPCVLDFGVAALVSEDAGLLTLTATGQVIGTLAYMAPEQAQGGEVGPAADQFALGAMLYELLTSELPLPVRGRLPVDALRLVADGEWTSPTRYDPTLAGDLEAILATALAREPNRRYVSVGAFADDLECYLDGRPIAARSPTALDGVGRFLRRHPLFVAGVASALLVLGGLGSFALQTVLEKEREGDVSLFFSDRALLEALLVEAEELWPLAGVPLQRFESWLDQAEGLCDRLETHRAVAGEFDVRSAPSGTRVADELGEAWLREQMRELVEGVETFAANSRIELRARRDLAANLRARTIEDHADAWRGVVRRVAADKRFDGLELVPQVGLVPLGPDPNSGLEEFAVYGTGAIPMRDDERQSIGMRVGDAVTLILIPGGEYQIGMPPDQLGDGLWEDAEWRLTWHEGPPVPVSLEPFLIGKFELTQDQWERWTGTNPSDWEPGSEFFGVEIGPTHPVETVSWQQAREVLPRWGLMLPTEAQWEVAARSGDLAGGILTSSLLELMHHANLKTHESIMGQDLDLPDDGFYTHMPVDLLEPNEYGLHHVIGNVWEFCADVYKVNYHELDHRPGDGLVLAEPDGDVSRRGGGAAMNPYTARIFVRGDRRLDACGALTGMRPARALQY